MSISCTSWSVSAGKDAFFSSRTLQDAVLRNLQTLAESTQRLSEHLKEEHPQIEWRRIAAFHNVLVHDYLGIDIRRIWEITRRDVPPPKTAVLSMVEVGE